jgi:hypothetical protein
LKARIQLIVFNLVTFVLLALILELLVFAGLERPSSIPSFLKESFREYYRTKDRQIIQVTECGQYDPELFYTLRPGECSFMNREFNVDNKINRKGLRDDEPSLRFPKVIALGDSYTMGWGVRQDESFPQILEQRLAQPVLNAGVSSYGTAREALLLRRLPMDSVRVLIWQYHPNDFEENIKYIENHYRLAVRTKYSYDSLRSAIGSRQGYYPFKHLYGVCQQIGKRFQDNRTGSGSQSREAQVFLDVVKHSGIEPHVAIFVFTLDDYNKLDGNFTKAVDSLLREPEYRNLNLKTINISNELLEEDYFILDDHINANGHRKLASKIHEQIISHSP